MSVKEVFVYTDYDGCAYITAGKLYRCEIKTLTGEKARAAKLFIIKACTVEPDKQGRILIPQNLREYAGLDHDVTVLGVINRAEIWDTAHFNEVSGAVTEEMLSDALSDIAF